MRMGILSRGLLALRWSAIAMLALGTNQARAAQVSDAFDTATYDGSYNTTLWDAGGTAPTLAQGSGKLTMTLPNSNWAPSSIATIAPVAIGQTLATRGTRFSATIDSFSVTTDGDQWRGGISIDHAFNLFFYDGAGSNGGMYGYSGAAFNVGIFLTNAAGQVAIEVNQKAAGHANDIGTGIGYRTVNVTFPLTVDVVMNNYYYELRLNGTKVLAGATNLEAIGIQNALGFEVIGASANNSRGAIVLDQVSVSDADSVPFTTIPTQITDDFASGPNAANLQQVEGVGGSAVVSGGAVTLTTPASDWATLGLQSTDLFPLNTTTITTYPLQVDLVSVNPTSGLVNTTLCVSEYPGSANFLNAPGYYACGTAAVAAVVLTDAVGANPVLSLFSKPTGTGYNNGATLIVSQAFALASLPATLRLEVSQTGYAVKINGSTIASGTHTAAFGDRVTGYFAVANQGGGRGACTYDNLLLGSNIVVPVELSAFGVE